jgi:hypothetical protein
LAGVNTVWSPWNNKIEAMVRARGTHVVPVDRFARPLDSRSPPAALLLWREQKLLKKIIAMIFAFDMLCAPRHPEGWQDSMFANR